MTNPIDRALVEARRLRARGVVQGVGFRPFVHRLAHRLGLAGWVRNGEDGVEIHVEGAAGTLRAFAEALRDEAPAAAQIAALDATDAPVEGAEGFVIHASDRAGRPTARIAPDLPVCDACLAELRDPDDRRFSYPYITCTDCGPRYSLLLDLPYDRPHTTMRDWLLCPACAAEYHDPTDRRFHTQPLACPACGPAYRLELAISPPSGQAKPPQGLVPQGEGVDQTKRHVESLSPTSSQPPLAPPVQEGDSGPDPVARAAALLRDGCILAVKGLGGYHLACDARNAGAVSALRERKVRKEKPFALMVRDLGAARDLVTLDAASETLLTSTARPVVLAPARVTLPGVAPDNRELGVMLPYAPLHHLLFDAGAPSVLVMTSANRSSEPIAYRDDDARARLAGLADAFLVGERSIARRVDDSVARAGPFGPVILRRARGYAPSAVATLPTDRPILALGADLKSAITLVVDGQAFVSQHLGDLDRYAALEAFRETVEDMLRMYEVDRDALLVVHDAHPQYASTQHALGMPGEHVAVQHHRAHIASVLAERGAWDTRAGDTRVWEKETIGVAFDGTGYGDDGSIWGGEVFAGSVATGFERIAHLHPALLPGGDAAARHPVQAAAGFLAALDTLPDLSAPPFNFPTRYAQACRLIGQQVRVFPTTSVGRLFDTAAALVGFTHEVSFEGQAAIWLEHLARTAPPVAPYPFPDLDFRPLLRALIEDRQRERPVEEIARAFHSALVRGVVGTARSFAEARGLDTVVLSGGVFQNRLLLEELADVRGELAIWTNSAVPPNDGGVSLGQAALAAWSGT